MALVISSPDISTVAACRRPSKSPANVTSSHNPRSFNHFANFRDSSKVRLRVRVCASVKDCEVMVSDCEQNVNLTGMFSAPVREGSSTEQRSGDEERRNYYVNIGHAIRTLREEFPDLFHREPSFDIYRDDIALKDPLYTFIGIENYKTIFRALRFNGRIFFKALWVDIISVWQPVESVIMVRWTAHGIPRVPWESRGRFDGISEYKLDKNGKIYEHRVHNIALNSPPKFQVLSVQELIQSIGCPSTPKPTFFESSSSYIMEFVPVHVKFSWIKCHLDSAVKLAKRYEAERLRRT